jgi:hypothetical protein
MTFYLTNLARKNMRVFHSETKSPDFVKITENDPVVPVL